MLRTQDLKYKNMSRKDLLEILIKEPNPNAGKSIVVDVESKTNEIDEAYDSLKRDELPFQKRIFYRRRMSTQQTWNSISPRSGLTKA